MATAINGIHKAGDTKTLIQVALSSNAKLESAFKVDRRKSFPKATTESERIRNNMRDMQPIREVKGNRKTIERIADRVNRMEARKDTDGLLKLADQANRSLMGQRSSKARRTKGSKTIRQSGLSRDLARLNRTKDTGALLDLTQGSLGAARRTLED